MIKRLFFFLTATAVLLSACKDNESFSTDWGNVLTFSVDTVKLDTLFSTVPSSTYNFWVYNKSGDGIRISNVRLERGNQSGFRANVDGAFLNPVATNFEIRKGDSIRVFVEITSHETFEETPQLVEDNLIFTLENGREQRVNVRTYSWDAVRMDGLTVSEDMTIETSRPIVVYGNGIQIDENATLTVKNTTLYFHDGAGISVKGRLEAEGSVFRGDRLDHMFKNLPYDRVSGQWAGIVLHPKAGGCVMKDCEVHSTYDGLWCDSTKVELRNTIIHNCRGYALYAHDSEVTLDNCQLSNTLADCLAIHGCHAEVNHTTLAQFYPFSPNRGVALRFSHTKQPVELVFSNTLVTGYVDDVLMGEHKRDSVSYQFTNCLLRTPFEDDAESFVDVIWEKSSDEIQGKQHFLNVDEKDMIYDFRIVETSPAYEKGIGRFVAKKEEEEQEQEQDPQQEEDSQQEQQEQ